MRLVKCLVQEHNAVPWLGFEPRLLNTGWVVRKPINANPGFKVDRGPNFSRIKVLLLLLFCGV